MSVEASNLSICKHHKPRWETDEVSFCSESDDTEHGKGQN